MKVFTYLSSFQLYTEISSYLLKCNINASYIVQYVMVHNLGDKIISKIFIHNVKYKKSK